MTTVKIGNQEFTTGEFRLFSPFLSQQEQLRDDYTRRMNAMLEGRLPRGRVTWACPAGPWRPAAGGTYRAVEPRLHVFAYRRRLDGQQYHGAPFTSDPFRDPTDAEIRADSLDLMARVMRATGFKTSTELEKALFDLFGAKRDYRFDVSTLLTEAERRQYSWQVTATLKFVHFSLDARGLIAMSDQVIVSLPDHVEYVLLRTHECVGERRVKMPAGTASETRSVVVRSATETGHKLRRAGLEARIAEERARLEEARRKLAEMEEQVERMKPEEEGD